MFLTLYFCRNLADVSNDNLLNVGEFIVALHLINGVLGGKQVPKVLPENLEVLSQEEVPIEVPSASEREAYHMVFQKCDQSGKSLINGKIKDMVWFFNLNKVGDTEHFKYQNCRYYWLSLIILIPALQGYFLTNLWQVEHLHSHTVLKNKSFILPRISRLFVSKVYKKPTINVKMTVIQCL